MTVYPTAKLPLFDRSPIDDDTPGLVRKDATDTSRKAAKRTVTGAKRKAAFDFIKARGARGATDEEIQRGLRMGANTERPRRKELQDQGVIYATDQRRPTESGGTAIVWCWVGSNQSLRTTG